MKESMTVVSGTETHEFPLLERTAGVKYDYVVIHMTYETFTGHHKIKGWLEYVIRQMRDPTKRISIELFAGSQPLHT